MTTASMLAEIDSTEGSTMMRTVEAYLTIMAIGDIVREHPIESGQLGRLEWELAGQLARLTGLRENRIRAHAVFIRMRQLQDKADSIMRTRDA